MATATVNKSFVALPWYGATVLVLEFTVSQANTTLDLTSLDGGQGLKYVDGIIEFTSAGSVTTSTQASSTAANSTTLSIANATSSAIVVIGR